MRITCIDFETANQNRASACSVGIACVVDGTVTFTKEWRIRPRKGFGFFRSDFTEIHGLTWFDVSDAPEFDAGITWLWNQAGKLVAGLKIPSRRVW